MVQERLEGLLLVSRTQNTSNTNERISKSIHLHVHPLISQVRYCSSILCISVYVHHSLSVARKNDRDNFR